MGDFFGPEHTALITGASSGIGAATAEAFGRLGIRVALQYNSGADRCREVAARVEQAGGTARIFQADVSDRAQCRQLAAAVLAEFGRVDTLVNNAGALGDRRRFLAISDEHWQKVLDTNLTSAFVISQAIAAHMLERGSGAIVNVSSVAGRNGGSLGVIAYATSKGGMTAMTKGMAKELIRSGIRVNAVNPGIIHTPLHERSTPPEQMQQLLAAIPQGRGGTPDEVARVIVFLAGPDAAHIVGESIEVNDGIVMM